MPLLRQPFGLKHVFGSIGNFLFNSSGTEIKQLADAQGIMRNRPYEPFRSEVAVRLGTGATTIYTVPAGTIAKVAIEVVNNTSTDRTATLYRVPSGGTADTTTVILNAHPMVANDFPKRTREYLLGPGGTFQGLCSAANAITATPVVVELYSTGDTV